jgi:hypothetical protein
MSANGRDDGHLRSIPLKYIMIVNGIVLAKPQAFCNFTLIKQCEFGMGIANIHH